MNLVRRNQRPLRRNDLFSVVDELFNSFPSENLKTLDRDFSPTLELKETNTTYLVEIDIPGMKKEDIELHFENNTLFVKGEKKVESKKDEGEKTHYTERFYGSFTRKIPFSEEVDSTKIEAKYLDGVLKIQLEKKPSDSPASRIISIQ